MLIDDIIDMSAVTAEIAAGYVTERAHPEFPELRILNYSDRCQFDRHWNDVTRLTRGMIYNAETRQLLARPFPKFHNYGEPEVGDVDLDAPIVGAFDKLDGSLGITYMRPDGKPAIATRGSFESVQAIHATRWLRSSPWGRYVHVVTDFTWVWEIIFPENRIVLDYGMRDELVYLGAIDHETGVFSPPQSHQAGAIVQAAVMPAETMREALAIAPRPNAEGMVVWLDHTRAVKIKQDDYVALHRVVSNLTVKEVWRQLRAGTFDEFVVALPDEFHQWALDTAEPLTAQHAWTVDGANRWVSAVYGRGFETRKDQALYIAREVQPDVRGLVFSLLDGKDIADAVWRMIEPKGPDTSRGDL